MKAAEIAIPILLLALIVFALFKKVNVYKAFVEGVGSSVRSLFSLLPYLAAMLTAIALLRGSGALDRFIRLIRPVTDAAGIDPVLVPITVLRPFSGSASLALLKDVLSERGPDSLAGRQASVIVGSTETVFYTVSVYFGAVGVTKTRQAVPAALISGAVGVAAALLIVR